jgi:hypothetical protein
MSTRSLVKILTLVIGFSWAIYIAVQWNEWSNYKSSVYQISDFMVQQMAMNSAEGVISSTKSRLIAQTLGALILICIGISIKVEDGGRKISIDDKKEFKRDSDVGNDAYKNYLLKKYSINKNDVLGGYTLNGAIYNSLEDVLVEAMRLDCSKLSHDKPSETSPVNMAVVGTTKSRNYFLYLIAITILLIILFILPSKFSEYKRNKYISDSMLTTVTAFVDDDLIHELKAKQEYKKHRTAYIIVLGKIAAYDNMYHSSFDANVQHKIKSILTQNGDNINKFSVHFKLGQKDALNDMQIGQYNGDGVWKQTGVISLDEAKYNINWFMGLHEVQKKTLLELRYDLLNNHQKALTKLAELAQEDSD